MAVKLDLSLQENKTNSSWQYDSGTCSVDWESLHLSWKPNIYCRLPNNLLL